MQSDKKQRLAEAVVDDSQQALETGDKNRQTALSVFKRMMPDSLLISGLFLLVTFAGLAFVLLNYKSAATGVVKSFQVAGVSITNQDKTKALQTLDKLAAAQTINISINDKTYTYKAADLGIKRDFSSVIEANYSAPDALINKLAAGENSQPGMQTYVQKKKLITAIESKLGQYKTTVDASVSVSGGNLAVNPSRAGIGLDFDEIAKQLEKTDLQADQTVAVNFTQSQPRIPTQASVDAKAQAETLIQPAYGVSANGGTPRFASAAQKASWLVFTPDEASHTISVSINSKSAQTTMTKIAQSFSQPPKNKITLTATDGSMSVIDNGQQGINVDQTSLGDGLSQLMAALDSRQAYTIPVTLAVQPQGERDLGTSTGGKFVLVDVADYRAYAIDNTTVDRTMVVSTGRPGLETPKGHFNIFSKTKLVTMHGCNIKVGCWVVPNVPNAEFFTKDGDALHGTYWYVNWGHQNASHGCVNLQLADAAWLYDWTQIGTDVIIA